MAVNSIRAVCFDLDNTLWDVWPVIRRAEQAMYDFLVARYPQAVAQVTIQSMREARMRVAVEHPQMAHDFSFLRMEALRQQARSCGCAETMAEEAFDVFLQARNDVELYADTRPALAILRQRFRLFSASNGNADLTRVGLAPFFERSIAAREVGALKPDPVVYLKVIEGTDLAPHEVLFVGDDPEHDVEGARRAGMLPVWINRNDAAWPQALELPAYSIKTLLELTRMLGLGAAMPAEGDQKGHSLP